MPDEVYTVPENPTYKLDDIRKIQDTDPVKASTIVNPVIEKLIENIAANRKDKQNKITAQGLLKADEAGNITAAEAGSDYAYPLLKGEEPPSEEVHAEVGQHYLDTSAGKEYVFTGEDWKLAGASDAADVTYKGGSLADTLDELSKSAEDGKTLTGNGPPGEGTKGAVGQQYVDMDTGDTYICTDDGGGEGPYQWMSTGGGGAVKPQLLVTVAGEGESKVTASCGDKSIVKEGVTDSVTIDLPSYGTWKVKAEKDGQTSNEESVVVDQVKQYSVSLSYFKATIKVTCEEGAEVTAEMDGHQFKGTCTGGNTCDIVVNYSGAYTVSATKNGVKSEEKSVQVSAETDYSVTTKFLTLTVTIDTGSNLTVSKDSHSYPKNPTESETTKFYLPETGTWKAKATKADQTAEGSVECSEYRDYTLELSYVKIFGVSWDYNNQNTALTRLKKADDPSKLVNVDIDSDPSPATAGGSGSSPFDAYMPWSGMEVYNITNNSVGPKKGTGGFSLSTDTVVFVPEFYFKVEDDPSGHKRRFYVADKPKSGFTKHPGSGVYVGRYNTSGAQNTQASVTGKAPLVSISRKDARTGVAQKGTGWQLYDYASWCAVWLLFLVEFANWDSQTVLGKGYTDSNSAVTQTGATDSMNYHTGQSAGTDGKNHIQYRNIEDPYGNCWEWIDGINFGERKAYICTDPSKYKDDVSTDYTDTGVTLCESGWIKGLGMSTQAPWAFLPDTNGGSATTFVPDYVYSDAGWQVLMVGGNYGNGTYAGLWFFYASNSSSYSDTFIGARLLYKSP